MFLLPWSGRSPISHARSRLIVTSFRNGGRLIYFGAGTSGRLGIVDASECPPTFGTDPNMVLGIIAGGQAAVFRSQEGAEDNEAQAKIDVDNLNVGPHDTVCGIAASRRTPYVVTAIAHARERGAKTIYITTNPRSEFNLAVDVAICPEVGPEVLMGSTRMKSGTAQKLVLNMLTTTAMVKLGKVYENMMVDLQQTNKKLVERSKRIVMMATGADYDTAAAASREDGGHVKTAIVMIKTRAFAGASTGADCPGRSALFVVRLARRPGSRLKGDDGRSSQAPSFVQRRRCPGV